VFAGYRVEELARRGGMGVVYRMRHLRLDRIDAVKVIAPEHAESPEFRARFEGSRASRPVSSIRTWSRSITPGRRTVVCTWRCATCMGRTSVRSSM
jgi:hypothetical protein